MSVFGWACTCHPGDRTATPPTRLWSATDSMRLQLGPRGVQVVGVHMGYVDTDMTAAVNAAKIAPSDVVRQVLDGVEAGALEVMADELTRDVRAGLHQPVGARHAPFLPEVA